MDKCWFVLRQSHYEPPQYASPTRALGKTIGGDIRLGDVVSSPSALYPLLSQGTLPNFSIHMRITSTSLCEFKWESSNARENSANAAAGAPIAIAAGVTLEAELGLEFKNTVVDWAEFSSLDVELVQPSRAYIDQVVAMSDVQDYINHHKKLHLGQWTIYVITGLMIARTSGTTGHSEEKVRGCGGGPKLDLAGALTAEINASHSSSTGHSRSGSFKGDRIWAIRLAKVHKGFLRSRWMQTEAKVGAALSQEPESIEDVSEVLQYEQWRDMQVNDVADREAEGNERRFILVQGAF